MASGSGSSWSRRLLALIVVGTVGTGGSLLQAGSASTSLVVSATVINSCTISATPLGFGNYDALAGAATDAQASVTITCTPGAPSTIALDNGTNASGSTRRMKDAGTNYLPYEAYQDSARTTVWGSGASSLDPGAAPSTEPRTYTVYGRIAAGQAVPAGAYTDTLTATVNF